MAASSSSLIQYEVFLNFRGTDTRKNFTSHLYNALRSKGVHTFIDSEELHVGEKIGLLLTKIQQSSISIPIFSKNYASSKWCLRELAQIFECYKTSNQTVLPIFLDVETSEVKHQTGSFGEDFHKHKDIEPEWKVALNEVCKLSGLVLKEVNGGDESKLIQLVAERVLSELNNTPLNVAIHPVGLDSRVDDLLCLLRLESTDPLFVGICGMGGMGKTTMAKAVYNRIFQQFDGSCFLADVREQASKKDLVYLQKQLLYDILEKQKFHVSSVDRGSTLIEKRLRNKKILIILDDVDDRKQLHALAGNVRWFGRGSRIIVTTRDEQILNVGQVDGSNIYKPEGLDDNLSLQLFSMHAFKKDQPPQDFLQLSRKAVSYAGGLPLTLEVLGCFLCGQECKEWESALKKLKKVPPTEVQSKLKISYDKLDHEEKAMFLDTACFFIGKEMEVAVEIWEACDMYPGIGLNVLIRKSLVKIVMNKLWMHDQLRDMGRQIVINESPEDPGQRSRLWSPEDITEVIKEHKGTRKVKAIFLNAVDIEGNIKHLPSKLRWLFWRGCPSKILPSNFSLEKLVFLDLSCSNNIKEAWRNGLQNKGFKNLKVLILDYCHNLAKSPNFLGFPRLEKLSFVGCSRLDSVHESIGRLQKLTRLSLSRCESLTELPCSIGLLYSLQILLLSASGLKKLPECIGDLKSLVRLDLSFTGIPELPNSIGNLKSLVWLNLDFTRICEIPYSIEMLTALRDLSLSNFVFQTRIPNSICKIKSLVNLQLVCPMVKEIPDDVELLENLEDLTLYNCNHLESLPKLPSGLIILSIFYGSSLSGLLDLSNLKNLQSLTLQYCKNLAGIHGLEGIESLEKLSVIGCNTLTAIPTEVLVQDGLNVQPFQFCKGKQRFVIGDDEMINKISMCLVFKLEEGVQIMERQKDKLLNGILEIAACIHRNGKRIRCVTDHEINCLSDHQIKGIQRSTSREIICIHYFQGLNWFGFPLKFKDEIEIELIRWIRYRADAILTYLKLTSEDQEHIQQPVGQQMSIQVREILGFS